MERRNDLEITVEILKIAERGAKKSHVAFEAKLNYKLLKHYLGRLEKQGLIANDVNPGNNVKTTEKGQLFVQQYRNLLQIVGQNEPNG